MTVNPTNKYNVNLSVWVEGIQDKRSALQHLGKAASEIPVDFCSMHLSSHGDFEIEAESEIREELYYNEDTLFKVKAAIDKVTKADATTQSQFVLDVISEIQNAGVLFRERAR